MPEDYILDGEEAPDTQFSPRDLAPQPKMRPFRWKTPYKPDYSVVRRLALVKRGVGIVLALLVLVVLLVLLLVWLIPTASDLFQRESATAEPQEAQSLTADAGTATVEAQPRGFDQATGLEIFDDAFNLYLINEDHPAPQDFSVITAQAGGVQVDYRIAPAVQQLLEQAQQDGISLELSAGYVSYGEQAVLYQRAVDALLQQGSSKVMANKDARLTASAPGECDQQTGLCITVRAPEDFESSPVYSWLLNNMGKYGFVFRYPAEKTYQTGREEDLTVLRYVGIGNAATMRRLSMCLEEFAVYVGKQ